MRLDQEFFYWSLPVILLVLYHSGMARLLGRGLNHNETFVHDGSEFKR
jgi:hypothetical protein